MKQTGNEWKKPVKVCDQSTGEEREKCLEKRKAYLKAAIRGVFFGLERWTTGTPIRRYIRRWMCPGETCTGPAGLRVWKL